MSKKTLCVGLAVATILAMSGCGGGSSNTIPAPTGGSGSQDRRLGGDSGSSDDRVSITQSAVKAAKNEPVSGSVTQSSDNGGSGSVSVDVVKVALSGNPTSGLRYDVDYNGQRVVTTERGSSTEGVEGRYDQPKGTELWERRSREGWHGIEFYRSLRGTDLQEANGDSVPAGDLWVDVYTDYEGEGDTDYLAGGIWVFAPDDATSVGDYEFGAFGDGNDPFTQSNLAGLTGTVTYSGEATAVYSVVATGRNYFPDATASLTASFGDGTDLGTIEGRIHDITGDGPASGYDGVVVNLGRANIGGANSGFFTGDTSTTGADSAFTGKWGGQFFGNGAAAATPPGSVGGTFGGATADGGQSFVGVFGAYRDEVVQPAPAPAPAQ